MSPSSGFEICTGWAVPMKSSQNTILYNKNYTRIDRGFFPVVFPLAIFFVCLFWVQAIITLIGYRYPSDKACPSHVSNPNVTISFSQTSGCFLNKMEVCLVIFTTTSPDASTCKQVFFLTVRQGTRNMR